MVPVMTIRGWICLLLTVPSLATLALAEDGPSIFVQNCAPCHGKDGKARTPMARKLGVKDLTQSQISDPQIEQQIREGRKGADGKQQMPSFGEKLSAEQLKLLIRYVKGLRPPR
jgi:mono/diheme cytochrome c family protein